MLISTGDKDMAQLVERAHHARQHDDRLAARPRRREEQVRRVSRTDRRLPRAGRRQHRQHSGRPKVGPKTAAKWLNDYGTLDKLVENAAAITGKVGEKPAREPAGPGAVAQARDARLRTSQLELRTWNRSCAREPDKERLRELYTRLELRALLRAARRRCRSGEAQPRRAPRRSGIGSRCGSAAARTTRSIDSRCGSCSAGSIGCNRPS